MSLVSRWKILYTLSAAENLRNLPKDIKKRIIEKMRFLVSSENPVKFAQTIKEKEIGTFRFRVGNYRIIFDIITEKTIFVVKIGKRDKVYK